MIRLFIALELDRQFTEVLQSFTASLNIDGARIIRADNLHITLKFLGYAEPNLLPPITEILKEIASKHNKFEITLNKLGAFPSRKKSRIFWIGSTEKNTMIEPMVTDLDKSLQAYGFKVEKRAFKIHLTLARFKNLVDLSEITQKNIEPIQQEIDHFSLFESRLSPKGAQYRVLNNFFLKNT